MVETIIICLATMFNYPNINTVNTVESAAIRHGVPPIVLHALVMQESSYDVMASNPADPSYGLGSIMPETARIHCGLPGYLLQSPTHNADCAAIYLAKHLETYNGNIDKALSAYNAGRYVKSNADYVKKIRKWMRRLNCEEGKRDSRLRNIGVNQQHNFIAKWFQERISASIRATSRSSRIRLASNAR